MSLKTATISIFIRLSAGIALILLILAVLFWLMQTKVVRRQLSARLEAALSSGRNVQVRFGAFEGLIPFDMKLERIEVSDGGGKWLELKNVVLCWSPATLLRGKLLINELGADTVRLDRLPRGSGKKSSWKTTLPTLPSFPVPLILEKFTIERLELGTDVMGKSAAFTVTGLMNSTDSAPGLAGSFRMKRVDRPTALASISWSLYGEPPLLAVHATVKEAENGLLAGIMGVREVGPLEVQLHGEGPARKWQGRLLAKAEGLGSIESSIELMAQEELRLIVEGNIQAAPSLFPAKIANFMENGKGRLSLDARFRGKNEIIAKRVAFHLNTKELELKAAGMVDFKNMLVQGEFSLELKDLASLERLTNTAMRGRLSAEGVFCGAMRQPQANLSVTVREVQVAGVRARKIEGELRLEPLGPLVSSFPGLQVKGKGKVEELSYHDAPPLPDRRFRWTLAARAPRGGDIAIDELELTGEILRLKLAGGVDPQALSFKGDAEVQVKDMTWLSGLAGKPLSGRTHFRARFDGNGRIPSLSAHIKGRLIGMKPPHPLLAPLTGPEILYSGRVEAVKDSPLSITDLQVQTGAAMLKGRASVDLPMKKLTGLCRIELPMLSPLSPSIGLPLEGSADIYVEIGGILSAFWLRAGVTGRNLILKGIRAQQVTATILARGLPEKPQGRYEISLTSEKNHMNTAGEFVKEGRRLKISRLIMTGPGTKITGHLNLDVHRFTAQGSLRGTTENLSALSAFAGEEIHGSASFEAQFSNGGPAQNLTLKLKGNKLATQYGSAEALELRSDVLDVLGTPKGDGEIRIQDFHRGDLSLDTIALNAEGSAQKMTFSGHAAGRCGESFELKASGLLHGSGKNKRLEFDLIQGRYERYLISLQEKAVIKGSRDGYTLEKASFRLGQGRLEAKGSFQAGEILLQAGFEGLPLEALRLAGMPDFTGSASGEIHMRGSPERPEGELELRLTDIRVHRPTLQEIPPVALVVNARLRRGQIQAVLSLSGLSEKPMEADMRCPLEFSLSPPAVTLPPKGDLRGRITAAINLANILSFLPLENQILEGKVMVDITVSGGVDTPEVSGFASIEKAAYENIRSGTILKDIHIRTEAKEHTIIIKQARATDGRNGAISAQGWVDVAPDRDFPLQLDIEIEKASLIQLDVLTVTTGGRLKLTGTIREPVLRGKVTIDPAEFSISDRLPSEITELDVIELNGPRRDTQSDAVSRTGRFERLGLDLTIDLPGRGFLRGRGLASEWKGTMRIRGNVPEPSITGTLSLVHGRFNFFGKSLALTSGFVTFDGTVPVSPKFDVTAEKKLSEIIAQVRFSGTPSEVSITLESEPPLPSEEILSRLLFGRSVAGITPVQGLRLTAALNTLAGGGSGLDVMNRTRKLLRLDQLDIVQSEKSNGKAAVSIGKYLKDDVYVEMEQGMGRGSGKISVEVEITPNVSVESEAGADAQGGIGINWKWDY